MLKQWMTSVSLFLCLISLSVILTLNCRALYRLEMKWSKLSEQTGYPEEMILSNYDALIEYNSVFYHGDLNFPSLSMSEEGRIHFVEVKNIFVFFQAVLFPVSLLLSLAGIWLLHREKPRYLKWTACLMLGVPAVLCVGIALYWDKLFVLFHKLLFDNEYWIFNYRTDPIILFLPDSYFMHCAIMILALVLLSGMACLGLYKISVKRKNFLKYMCSSVSYKK